MERSEEDLGPILRSRRAALNLTQEDIADVSSSVVRKAENGYGLPTSGLKRAAYARGLQWLQGAFDLLLDGADPADFDRVDSEPEPEALAALRRELATITPDEAARISAFLAGLRPRSRRARS